MVEPGGSSPEVQQPPALIPDQLPDMDEIKKENEGLRRLNAERERALEGTAQSLRQPLIDQLSWCELLMTDSERSLRREHVELVAKINSTANDLLGRVQDLLDDEKILERAGKTERAAVDEQRGEAHDPGLRLVTEAGMGHEQADALATPALGVEITAPSSWVSGLPDPRRSDAKVLVVEDSSTLRDLLVSVLRPTFHVFSAADGWEALKLIVDRPDVIVTELDLPNVGAADLLSHARRIIEGVAVLALCYAQDAASLTAARSLGIREVLLKPFPIPAVVEKVEALSAARERPPNKSVLVVCPDSRQAYALHHLLDARYRVQIAPSAEAARNAGGEPFDLLVVDVAAGNGWWQDVVAFFRESHAESRVLALIDGKDKGMLGSLGSFGVDAAVLKPYSCDDLLQRVRGLLGIKEIEGSILRSVFRRAAV